MKSGMKNTRVSIGKVPGHKRVGAALARVIGTLLDERPRIIDNIHGALGAPKESGCGPAKEDILD